MSTEYSGSSASFPITVTLPSGGDNRLAVSVTDGLSDLSDRTAYLHRVHGIVQDVALLNWHPDQGLARISPFTVTDTEAFASAYTRSDGTAELFWSVTAQIWFALGRNQASWFYFGDNSRIHKLSTGSTFKYSFGVESSDRLLFFCHDQNVASSLKYSRSGAAADFTTWTDLTLPTTAGGQEICNDAVHTSAGNVIAVGGIGGVPMSWTSADNGATFTRHAAAGLALTATSYLSGVSEGKSHRIFAWLYATAANGGDKLYYSDNEGTTWTATSSIAHEKIRNVIYIAERDHYVVVTDTHIGTSADPIGGSILWSAVPGVLKSSTTDGSAWVYVAVTGTKSVVSATFDVPGTSGRLLMIPDNSPFCIATGGDGQFGTLGPDAVQFSLKAAPRP